MTNELFKNVSGNSDHTKQLTSSIFLSTYSSFHRKIFLNIKFMNNQFILTETKFKETNIHTLWTVNDFPGKDPLERSLGKIPEMSFQGYEGSFQDMFHLKRPLRPL